MLKKLALFAALLFFLLMMVVPATYQLQRGLMLAVLCGISVPSSVAGSWKVNHSILTIGLVCIAVSIFYVLYGILNNAPGALAVSTVYVAWPLLYIYILGALNRPVHYLYFIKTIILGVIISSLMGLMLVASDFGFGLAGVTQFIEAQGGLVGVYDGKIEFFLLNTSTAIYGLLFLLCLLVLPREYSCLNKKWHFLSFIALALSFLQVMLSGRRAFVLIGVLGPLIVYILFKVCGLKNPFNSRKIAIAGFGFSLVLIGFYYYSDLSGSVMLDDFLSGFDFADNANRRSSSVRGDQFRLLGQGWLDTFLFGHGHGSFHPAVVSDDTAPWSYELGYVALLFQVGIVGVGVYLFSLAWLAFKAISMVRMQHRYAAVLLPLLAGLLGFLIANATNPYLSKFDYLWTIFILVGAVNCFEIEGGNPMNSGESKLNAI